MKKNSEVAVKEILQDEICYALDEAHIFNMTAQEFMWNT